MFENKFIYFKFIHIGKEISYGAYGTEAYPEFKRNTVRLESEEVPDFYKTGKQLAKTFTTSYKYINKKLAEYYKEKNLIKVPAVSKVYN